MAAMSGCVGPVDYLPLAGIDWCSVENGVHFSSIFHRSNFLQLFLQKRHCY